MTHHDAYVICTSPRSGSTLLCKLLTATGVAGRPGSYFHRPSIQDWLAYFNLSPGATSTEREVLEAIFRAAIAKGRGDTGMFGLRLQRHSFDFFAGKLAVLHPTPQGDAARLQAAFGRTLFIHLTRLDKVGQAVSYVKAQQTGLWHKAPDGTELERLSPPAPPCYDAARLRDCLGQMTEADRAWEDWFARERIAPLRLTYEALSADPPGALRQVLEALGADRKAADGIVPGVARLADATSREWTTRLRAEIGTG
jgi:LPS sulfotransferase NodH